MFEFVGMMNLIQTTGRLMLSLRLKLQQALEAWLDSNERGGRGGVVGFVWDVDPRVSCHGWHSLLLVNNFCIGREGKSCHRRSGVIRLDVDEGSKTVAMSFVC